MKTIFILFCSLIIALCGVVWFVLWLVWHSMVSYVRYAGNLKKMDRGQLYVDYRGEIITVDIENENHYH
jgi:hypothetical protein